MERVILHSDLNSFYASVEMLYQPKLREIPMAVGGDPEQRHGIILAKNEAAKKFRVATGEPLWQAKQKCPDLTIVPPHFSRYLYFSKLVREIYLEYTDQVEPFGIDECWLDVTGSTCIYGNGIQIAEQIRKRIWNELGVTVSIGVSNNKITSKLGSDYKKPNAITEITLENYKQIVYPLPVSSLLYVGPATSRKLCERGIHTIGQLAQTDQRLLTRWFGKMGGLLSVFSNGLDRSPVAKFDECAAVKSIGNSTTTCRDMENDEDIRMIFTVLAESVAARVREQGLKGETLCIFVRDNTLHSFTRQQKLPYPCCLAQDMVKVAMELFRKYYDWTAPVRSIGLSIGDFVYENAPVQMDLYGSYQSAVQQEKLAQTVDILRRRFGNGCIQRAVVLLDRELTHVQPGQEFTMHLKQS